MSTFADTLAAFVVCLMLAAGWASTPRPAPASANTEVPSPSADRMWALPEAPTTRPVPQPSPVVATDLLSSQPTNVHEANVSPARLSGIASWYRYVPGQAAAGPRLRAMLGDWRGTVVVVSRDGFSVRTQLSDWCQCHEGQPDERLVDLDARTFSQIAPLSRGLVVVDVGPDH